MGPRVSGAAAYTRARKVLCAKVSDPWGITVAGRGGHPPIRPVPVDQHTAGRYGEFQDSRHPFHDMKPTASPPYPGTQAVQRAMRLLKAVAAAHPDVGVVELARGAGLHKATAFRLLSALERAEMVQRGPSGEGYRLGPELLRLASQALGSEGLQAAAAPTLQALAGETRETITLEVLVGHEVLILDEVVGSHVIGAMP